MDDAATVCQTEKSQMRRAMEEPSWKDLAAGDDSWAAQLKSAHYYNEVYDEGCLHPAGGEVNSDGKLMAGSRILMAFILMNERILSDEVRSGFEQLVKTASQSALQSR